MNAKHRFCADGGSAVGTSRDSCVTPDWTDNVDSTCLAVAQRDLLRGASHPKREREDGTGYPPSSCCRRHINFKATGTPRAQTQETAPRGGASRYH